MEFSSDVPNPVTGVRSSTQPVRKVDGLAVASFALAVGGLTSLFGGAGLFEGATLFFSACSVVAVILGIVALVTRKRRGRDGSGMAFAVAGIIGGSLAVLFQVVVVLGAYLFILFWSQLVAG